MKRNILKILDLQRHNYELLLADNYFLWCELQSFDERHLQNLLANPILFGWWQEHYSNLEATFIEIVTPYLKTEDIKTIRAIYTEETIKIRSFYPKTILNASRPKYAKGKIKSQATRVKHHLN